MLVNQCFNTNVSIFVFFMAFGMSVRIIDILRVNEDITSINVS